MALPIAIRARWLPVVPEDGTAGPAWEVRPAVDRDLGMPGRELAAATTDAGRPRTSWFLRRKGDGRSSFSFSSQRGSGGSREQPREPAKSPRSAAASDDDETDGGMWKPLLLLLVVDSAGRDCGRSIAAPKGFVGDCRLGTGAEPKPDDARGWPTIVDWWRPLLRADIWTEAIVMSAMKSLPGLSSRARCSRAAAARLPIDLDARREGVPARRSDDVARLAAEKVDFVGVLGSKKLDSRRAPLVFGKVLEVEQESLVSA